MRFLIAALASSMALFAPCANAADEKMTIAVFTKNSTNPPIKRSASPPTRSRRAAEARIVHYVPKKPDNVDEQKAMVEQVLKDRPDAVIFIPVDDVAMIDSVKKLNEAKIPVVLVSNPLPGQFCHLCRRRRQRDRIPRGALSVRTSRRQGQDRRHRGHAGRAHQPRARARLHARAWRISRHRAARLRHRQLPATRRQAGDDKIPGRLPADRRRAVGQ